MSVARCHRMGRSENAGVLTSSLPVLVWFMDLALDLAKLVSLLYKK